MSRYRAGRRRCGSLAVEAAIFLPLFIIGVLTLGWLIRFTAVSENVYHALADETRRYAADMALSYMPGKYKGAVKSRIMTENKGDVASAEISPARFHVPHVSAASGRGYTDLIGASVSYKANLGIPHIFSSGLTGSETILCRAFVGTRNPGGHMPFSEMEDDHDSHLVWVFPRAGERYHGENCSYIKNEPHEVILNGSVRGRYAPCKLCKPDSASGGTLVYVFRRAGGVYHLGGCYIVERYVISMSEDEAKEKGYGRCSKCGGG
jgi:hypothetical protein